MTLRVYAHAVLAADQAVARTIGEAFRRSEDESQSGPGA